MIEPPWYGPVCQVVWEGQERELLPVPIMRNGLGQKSVGKVGQEKVHEEVIIPRGATLLEANDKLMILAEKESLKI